jgi:hypothetical protein
MEILPAMKRQKNFGSGSYTTAAAVEGCVFVMIGRRIGERCRQRDK